VNRQARLSRTYVSDAAVEDIVSRLVAVGLVRYESGLLVAMAPPADGDDARLALAERSLEAKKLAVRAGHAARRRFVL